MTARKDLDGTVSLRINHYQVTAGPRNKQVIAVEGKIIGEKDHCEIASFRALVVKKASLEDFIHNGQVVGSSNICDETISCLDGLKSSSKLASTSTIEVSAGGKDPTPLGFIVVETIFPSLFTTPPPQKAWMENTKVGEAPEPSRSNSLSKCRAKSQTKSLSAALTHP